MPQQILVEQTPLETLVVSQIAEIRKRESALQEHLGRLLRQKTSSDQEDLAEEMWHLQKCTDRLNRMMDAMSGYSRSII